MHLAGDFQHMNPTIVLMVMNQVEEYTMYIQNISETI